MPGSASFRRQDFKLAVFLFSRVPCAPAESTGPSAHWPCAGAVSELPLSASHEATPGTPAPAAHRPDAGACHGKIDNLRPRPAIRVS